MVSYWVITVNWDAAPQEKKPGFQGRELDETPERWHGIEGKKVNTGLTWTTYDKGKTDTLRGSCLWMRHPRGAIEGRCLEKTLHQFVQCRPVFWPCSHRIRSSSRTHKGITQTIEYPHSIFARTTKGFARKSASESCVNWALDHVKWNCNVHN